MNYNGIVGKAIILPWNYNKNFSFPSRKKHFQLQSICTKGVNRHLCFSSTLPKLKTPLYADLCDATTSSKDSSKKFNFSVQSGFRDPAESGLISDNTNSFRYDKGSHSNLTTSSSPDSLLTVRATNKESSDVAALQAPSGLDEVENTHKKNKNVVEKKENIIKNRVDKRPVFPFTAIVGQEEMKLALLLNVIDPKIGGVMIMGDRGTGKSTTVRALVDLLPNIEVVENDPFNSHPSDAELMSQNVREQVLQGKELKVVSKKTAMIDLPLGATEDRVCGTIDIEKALSEGVKAFEPGLLAKANRGILYVDEVNLLDDHLVDILLDSAASGWNTVEREGISISHPARFILVGSGNPEEGELRPQLLDRFGMHAQIGTVREAELRVQIVEERAKFDHSPIEFLNVHAEKQKKLAEKIVAARHLLGAVNIDYDLRIKISQICGQLNVDGLRGDIVTNLAGE